jgi:hypothetical protein
MKHLILFILLLGVCGQSAYAPMYNRIGHWADVRITAAGMGSRITCEGKRIIPYTCAIEQGTYSLGTVFRVPNRGRIVVTDYIPRRSSKKVRRYWERKGKDYDVHIDIYYKIKGGKTLTKLDMGIKKVFIEE